MDDAREITREEAIANLNMISVAFVEPVTEEQRKLIDDTFDMAIKALEQEPKTVQEKQAESEKYQKAFDDGYENGYAQARFDYEQEPKTGHWILHEKPHGIRYLECPYCNIWYLNEHLIRNSYCPNCGAKMVEPQTNAEEAEEYQIGQDISKGFEEFTRMMFKQGQGESEEI